MCGELETRPAPKDEAAAVKAVEGVIAQHPFLAGLKQEHLRVLAENAMQMQYQQGELIFREGDPANRFYLIQSGRVSLESHCPGDPAVLIQTIGSGDVLGWSWLFPPYNWHFDARAIEPTTAIFFYGTRVRERCEEDRDLGFELMKRMVHIIVQRLQATRKQLIQVREQI